MLADGGCAAFAERVEEADGVGVAGELADVDLVGPVEAGYLVVGGELATGASWGQLSRPDSKTRTQATRKRAKMPGEGGYLGGAAYRNRTDDLRITRGPDPRSHGVTCTDSTADGIGSTDRTGFRGHPFHDSFHARRRTAAASRYLTTSEAPRPSWFAIRPGT